MITDQLTDFERDVLEGLSSNPKQLSSRYFYDEKGDKLFQKIMALEEYYLTAAEFEILSTHGKEIVHQFCTDPLQLVELGAGDGLKTKILLDELVLQDKQFSYLPIDISTHALDGLLTDLRANYPGLKGTGIKDDYFNALKRINDVEKQKMVMFLGSNIGNYSPGEAKTFLMELRENLQRGDILLIGIDLKKDPEIIRKAYNDSQGVTRDFNLNLLIRINRELDANFDIDSFEHVPEYDPETGAAESYLKSKKEQVVRIEGIGENFNFEENECIRTEVSQKYTLEEIGILASESGFFVQKNYQDKRGYFVDTVWKAV